MYDQLLPPISTTVLHLYLFLLIEMNARRGAREREKATTLGQRYFSFCVCVFAAGGCVENTQKNLYDCNSVSLYIYKYRDIVGVGRNGN